MLNAISDRVYRFSRQPGCDPTNVKVDVVWSNPNTLVVSSCDLSTRRLKFQLASYIGTYLGSIPTTAVLIYMLPLFYYF